MSDQHGLPLPFTANEWPRKQQEAIAAFSAWYRSLHGVVLPEDAALEDEISEEKEQLRLGKAPRWVSLGLWGKAQTQASLHRIDPEHLLAPLDLLKSNGRPLQFKNKAALYAHIEATLVPFARILGRFAEVDHSWQRKYVTEFARGFFVIRTLVHLKQDLNRDRLFIPMVDLHQASVERAALMHGHIDENIRKLLWKQVIRARDAFSHAQPLVQEVPRRYRSMVKRAWVGGLEVLGEIERRKYDVWSRPITLSPFQQAQVFIQTRLGKATSRKK